MTNKELAILEVLMAAAGRVVSTEELLERVWDIHTDPFTNTVRVTVGHLRRKIGDPPLISTVIGAGYRWWGHDPPAPPLRAVAADAHLHRPFHHQRHGAARRQLPAGATPGERSRHRRQSHLRHGGQRATSHPHRRRPALNRARGLALNPAQCPTWWAASTTAPSAPDRPARDRAPARGCLQAPVPPATKAEVHRLTAAVSASQSHTLNTFKIASAIALGIITMVSFGLSWWMAGRALAPVHRITDAARSLSERTLHARINLRGPNDELKQLADTFDAMLGRLERAFTSQRRFVANASHELRTPLATERVLIDEALANRSAKPDDLQAILEQLRVNSEDTERLIDALLVLARPSAASSSGPPSTSRPSSRQSWTNRRQKRLSPA